MTKTIDLSDRKFESPLERRRRERLEAEAAKAAAAAARVIHARQRQAELRSPRYRQDVITRSERRLRTLDAAIARLAQKRERLVAETTSTLAEIDNANETGKRSVPVAS